MKHYVNIGIPILATCCLMLSCSTKMRIENAYKKKRHREYKTAQECGKKSRYCNCPKDNYL